MADPVLTPRQLRSARERLIDRGVTDASVPPSSIGVRPAIERSWRRAVAQHIAADAAAARFVNAINTDDPLLRAAAPVVEHWQDCLSGMHVATFLSDRSGQIVARRVSDRGDMRRLDQVFAAEGFDFSESSLGTNGLGTAIEDRVPVFVRGGEHFSESLESQACAGAPIRDLGTGQVLGSLAFAALADTASPLMLAMARQAVAEIEQRFAQAAAPPGLAAAITAIAGGRLASRPVLVLSEQAVIANTLALGFVSAELHAALWETLRSVDWTGVSAEVVRLPGSMGEATAHIARVRPEDNFLCCEVHEPGVGALLKRIGEQQITNIRICAHDAVEVLEHMLAPGSLAGIHVFFPDPWHKKRHNKRRLIQPPFVRQLAEHLQPGGYLHCATDWQPYAEQMREVLGAEPLLANTSAAADGWAPKPDYRPLTKFENRGLKLGHGVWDVVFRRR